jgi:hypothetical protein
MGSAAQAQALKNYRRRLAKRGMARFEVLGLATDRELVRAFARRLAEESPAAEQMRAAVREKVTEEPDAKGGIWTWLRNSPLVGADLNLERPFTPGRKIDL